MDFTLGDPDIPTPDGICEAAFRAIREHRTRYTPSAGLLQLREAIAAYESEKCGIDISAENVAVTEGKLVMKVQGRVDTLTAAQLLKAFQDLSPQADSIELDVEKMPYISSAGLRVLLIMRKSVKDPGRFKIFHIRPEVQMILKMTGFDTLML